MNAYDRWVRVNREYVQYYDLVINRIKIINQILGTRYDLAPGNPCVLKVRFGWTEVYYCKSCISTFEIWDVDGVRLAYERLDTLADTLWRYSCIGYDLKGWLDVI